MSAAVIIENIRGIRRYDKHKRTSRARDATGVLVIIFGGFPSPAARCCKIKGMS
jgi:hypothetical protein